MDERDNLTVQDEEFEKMLRNGLKTSYGDDGLCVSEDLIARTLKAIEADAAEPVTDIEAARRAKRSRFIKIASGIAAAAFIGVIGVTVIRNGMGTTKSAPANEMFMVNSKTSFKADDSVAYDALVYDEACYDYDDCAEEDEAEAPMFAFSETKGMDEGMDMANGICVDAECDDTVRADGSALDNTCTADSAAMEPASKLMAENSFYYSGDEYEELYKNIYDTAISSCTGTVYELTGFMTDDKMYMIPDDLGECLLSITYMGGDCWSRGTIYVYEKYCDIHDDKPLSSNFADYSSILYRVDDGRALAEAIRAKCNTTE